MTCLARAVQLVDRYGDAIEYDLHTRAGLDLLDFFRGKYSWRKLLVILDHLPVGSAYWAARAGDDELAEELAVKLRADEKRGAPTQEGGAPALSDMTLTNQTLMSLVDAAMITNALLDRLGGGKPSQPSFLNRPATALEKAKALVEAEKMTDLMNEVAEAQARNN